MTYIHNTYAHTHKIATVFALVFSPLESVGQWESLVWDRNCQPPLLVNLYLFTRKSLCLSLKLVYSFIDLFSCCNSSQKKWHNNHANDVTIFLTESKVTRPVAKCKNVLFFSFGHVFIWVLSWTRWRNGMVSEEFDSFLQTGVVSATNPSTCLPHTLVVLSKMIFVCCWDALVFCIWLQAICKFVKP